MLCLRIRNWPQHVPVFSNFNLIKVPETNCKKQSKSFKRPHSKIKVKLFYGKIYKTPKLCNEHDVCLLPYTTNGQPVKYSFIFVFSAWTWIKDLFNQTWHRNTIWAQCRRQLAILVEGQISSFLLCNKTISCWPELSKHFW